MTSEKFCSTCPLDEEKLREHGLGYEFASDCPGSSILEEGFIKATFCPKFIGTYGYALVEVAGNEEEAVVAKYDDPFTLMDLVNRTISN